ncbi:MAG: winged helix DNA-binding domain-containing protein [Cohaesibacter sp.]|jgi:uncharacterized protein YcaQ|nr:winged helix DNA-binding domain-containing protein [Cohaesibacter sp.]
MAHKDQSLTNKQARRIALAAQGFLPRTGRTSSSPSAAGAVPGADTEPAQLAQSPSSAKRPTLKRHGVKRHDARHFDEVMRHIGLLQLDSVNVLERAHYLTLFARLGSFDKARADQVFHDVGRAQQTYFEYWGHEASLLPCELYPALRWRMDRAARFEGMWRSLARFGRDKKALIEDVYREVEQCGPATVSELEKRGEKGKSGGWWGWNDTKIALEVLFWSGRISSAGRHKFQRHYDIPERVLPASILAKPALDEASAHRCLMEIGARCHGIGTEKDFRDYFRLDAKPAKQALGELIEEGLVEPVEIEGYKVPTYRHKDAFLPARANCQSLLAPFDSLIFHRERTELLFGCHYRIEIYVPKEKRRYGYYVLPYLLGDQIVARLDLKANRQDGVLEVQACHLEGSADEDKVLTHLAPELERMAEWQGLSAIRAHPRGTLAAGLVKRL